jgi:uncharacterized protein (DUF433 family)
MHIVVSDPEILWGTPVFSGTRIPTETLFDYIEAGDTLDSFLRDFPSISRNTAIETLRNAHRAFVDTELQAVAA